MFKATSIQSPEDIFKACGEIQSFLESPYDSDSPQICVERATDLEVRLAQSSKMVADAEYHFNSLLQSSIMTGMKTLGDDVMSATILRQYIAGATKDFQYLVKWTERLNRCIVHDLDIMRTIISMHKSESTRFQT